MAGTRVWVQGVVLAELLLLTAIALYAGFCDGTFDDALCRRVRGIFHPPEQLVHPLEVCEAARSDADGNSTVSFPGDGSVLRLIGVSAKEADGWNDALRSMPALVSQGMLYLKSFDDDQMETLCNHEDASQALQDDAKEDTPLLFICPSASAAAAGDTSNDDNDDNAEHTRFVVVQDGTTYIHVGVGVAKSSLLREIFDSVSTGDSSSSVVGDTHSFRLHVQIFVEPDRQRSIQTNMGNNDDANYSKMAQNRRMIPRSLQHTLDEVQKYLSTLTDDHGPHIIDTATPTTDWTMLPTSPSLSWKREMLEAQAQQAAANEEDSSNDEDAHAIPPPSISSNRILSMLQSQLTPYMTSNNRTTLNLMFYIPADSDLPLHDTVWRLDEIGTIVALVSQADITDTIVRCILHIVLRELTTMVQHWELQRLPHFWLRQHKHAARCRDIWDTYRIVLQSGEARHHKQYNDAVRDARLPLPQVPMHTTFLIEHYFALFAPLLFPLLLPFLVQLVREYKRYKQKKQQKTDKTKTE